MFRMIINSFLMLSLLYQNIIFQIKKTLFLIKTIPNNLEANSSYIKYNQYYSPNTIYLYFIIKQKTILFCFHFY